MLKRLLPAAFLALLSLCAHATNYTDIWWNPAESGWGINLVQSDKFIFATFFVYGSGNTPTWYAGTLTLDASGSFTGSLFSTTGTYLGTVPFNPAQGTLTQVGTASFSPSAADRGVLSYNVGSVAVVKNIQRQTLTAVPLAGTYSGGIALEDSACSNPADNATVQLPVDITVAQPTPGQVQMTLDILLGLATCTLSNTGAVTQTGSMFSFPSTYVCSSGGPQTTATVYELRVTSLGIEGRFTAPNALGCREDGRFSGVLY